MVGLDFLIRLAFNRLRHNLVSTCMCCILPGCRATGSDGLDLIVQMKRLLFLGLSSLYLKALCTLLFFSGLQL